MPEAVVSSIIPIGIFTKLAPLCAYNSVHVRAWGDQIPSERSQMDVNAAVARILKTEQVEWVSCFPSNELIESVAK